MMRFLLAEQERRPRGRRTMGVWQAGGDTVPVSVQDRFWELFGGTLSEGYALTECLVITAHRRGSIGRALTGMEVRLVDPAGLPVAPGQ